MPANYQKELDEYIESCQREGKRPHLLIHACCAPCSSYVLEYLNRYFDIDLLFYNPNIDTETEFLKRLGELERLTQEMPFAGTVKVINAGHRNDEFESMAAGLENEPERGKRCLKCYELRLREAARYARDMKEQGIFYDCFATTLTLSPLKNAAALNGIGKALENEYGIPYLVSDFKKKNGFKRSIELSREYDLYRQNYCGCRFSRKAADAVNIIKQEELSL